MSDAEKTLDSRALHRIGYGLYLLTSRLGERDNACIVNAVIQVTSTPCRIAVAVNQSNFSHAMIRESGALNLHCLSVKAPFSLFRDYGFASGKDKNKFPNGVKERSKNGLPLLTDCVSAYFSLRVEASYDLGTHTLFIGEVEEAGVVSSDEPMSYAYYHANVKPKPTAKKETGYVCRICGYVHYGDTIPDDFICPICKHGASDFEKAELSTEAEEKEDGGIYRCGICGYEYKEGLGISSEGIPPNTPFSELPEDFKCPICGVEKAMFEKKA